MQRLTYDPRLRNDVARTGNIHIFDYLETPSSTMRTWRARGQVEFVTIEPDHAREADLRDRLERAERKLRIARAKIVLLTTVLRVLGVSLEHLRVPTALAKKKLLRAIRAAKTAMTLPQIAKAIGISPARYYAWVEADAGCALPDTPSCPRTKPTQLTFEEVHTMREMVTSKSYRHMSVRALALHAQRLGRVFAHPGTWCRLIREHAWVRPRKRLYPPTPKVGLRTSAPNQAWHLDRTIIKPAPRQNPIRQPPATRPRPILDPIEHITAASDLKNPRIEGALRSVRRRSTNPCPIPLTEIPPDRRSRSQAAARSSRHS